MLQPQVITPIFLHKTQVKKFAPMRQTQRRRLLLEARIAGEKQIAGTIESSLNKQYKILKRELRRANLRKTLKKSEGLYKRVDEWRWWIDEFNDLITGALSEQASILAGIEDSFFLPSGVEPKSWDYLEVVKAYESRVGKKIKDIGSDTLSDVQEKIGSWYQTHDTLPMLISELEPIFGQQRAELIASTELNYVASEVSFQQMTYMGINYWLWDAFGDACSICLDIQAQSHISPFKLGDPMPPDASHPKCRCGVLYANEDGSPLSYGSEL